MTKRIKIIATIMVVVCGVYLAACSSGGNAAKNGAFSDENKIPYSNLNGEDIEGAAGAERDADVGNSKYYTQLDYYNMKSGDTLTILENFKTYQQVTEWTCGPAAVLMVLEWYGLRGNHNDLTLAALRHKEQPGSTNLRQMIYIIEELNSSSSSTINSKKLSFYSTYDLEEIDINTQLPVSASRTKNDIPEDMILTNLKNGIPTIIGWDDWGGHWTVVIGYDTMGTETTADDVLIIADPYDTTDHCQDGYVVQPFERLYYNWKNTFDPQFKNNVFLTLKLT